MYRVFPPVFAGHIWDPTHYFKFPLFHLDYPVFGSPYFSFNKVEVDCPTMSMCLNSVGIFQVVWA